MRVFVVNLARHRDRLAHIDGQMRRLGVAYERVEAVDAMAMDAEAMRRAVRRFRWWCAMGREVIPGEIGCALSHYGIYRRIEEPACIVEDDAVLGDRFQSVLDFVSGAIDPARPQVVMLSDFHRRFDGSADDGPRLVRIDGTFCTDGYVITPPAARALAEANTPMSVPCDSWSRWVAAGLIELHQALPVVVRQERESFGSTTSLFRHVSDFSAPELVMHKAKRLVGLSIDRLLSGLGF